MGDDEHKLRDFMTRFMGEIEGDDVVLQHVLPEEKRVILWVFNPKRRADLRWTYLYSGELQIRSMPTLEEKAAKLWLMVQFAEISIAVDHCFCRTDELFELYDEHENQLADLSVDVGIFKSIDRLRQLSLYGEISHFENPASVASLVQHLFRSTSVMGAMFVNIKETGYSASLPHSFPEDSDSKKVVTVPTVASISFGSTCWAGDLQIDVYVYTRGQNNPVIDPDG